MGSTVGINKLTAVHKQSGGTVSFMPDVCLTPSPPGPPVPIPYPNTAVSADADQGAKSVTADGQPLLMLGSTFKQSTGDEPGSVGGVASGCTKGAAVFVGCSFDVLVEGKGAARFSDLMLGNKGGSVNTPPSPEVQSPAPGGEAAPGDLEPDRIELTVTDTAGNPLADVRYVLETPAGKTVEGKTDASGKITVSESVRGIGRITFPDHSDGHVDVKD